MFGAVGGAVPLLPHPAPVPGLGSAERDGPAHLAEEAHLLALHLDLRGQHAGPEPLGFVFVFFGLFSFLLVQNPHSVFSSPLLPLGGSSGGFTPLPESGGIFPAASQTSSPTSLCFILPGESAPPPPLPLPLLFLFLLFLFDLYLLHLPFFPLFFS